jgi:ABC-type transport system substrate-binding protein
MQRYQGALRVPVSRRRFLWLMGAAAGVTSSGLLAACGSGDDDGETDPSSGGGATATTGSAGENTPATDASGGTTPAVDAPTSPAGEDERATGGELIVAATQDGYRTEPNRANVGMYPLNTNIFETLVRLTPDYQVEPMLAESWEFVEPNTWRFVLREGVTFHDGTPFTAEAVQWSMGRIAAAGGG